MQRTDASDTMFLAIGGALLSVSTIALLRIVPFRPLCVKILSLMRMRRGEARDEEVELIVKTKMQAAKLRNVGKCIQAVTLVVSGWTCMMMINIVLGTAVRRSFSADVVQMAAHGLGTVVVACPRALSWRTIDIIYMLWILCATLILSPLVCEPDKLLYRTLVMDLMVLSFNVMRGSLYIVLPLNLIFASVSSLTILRCGQELPIPVMYLVFAQVMFITFFPACAHHLECSMESVIRQSLEVKAVKELLSAANALLRTVCDVVVECDSEGLILCPALDLGSFLLRGAGNRNLQGTFITNLMCDEQDKRMFLRKLSEPRPSGIGLADVVHVQMRDGSSALLKVEILTFEFRNMGGQQRYMIGLRHFSDVTWVNDDDQTGAQQPHEAGPEVSATTDEDDEEQSSRSGSSSVTQLATAPTVILDTTQDCLPILGWSPSFQMKLGRLPPESGLRDLVEFGDDFVKWMAMAVVYGSDWPNARVTLTLRQGRVRASCRVLHDTDEPINPERIQLVFVDIKREYSPSDGSRSSRPRPHKNYRGTPVLHMTL